MMTFTVKDREDMFKAGNIRQLRRAAGLNQQQFWSAIGITQSGGSRYESGRRIPKVVKSIIRLVYVQGINIHDLNRADVAEERRLPLEPAAE